MELPEHVHVTKTIVFGPPPRMPTASDQSATQADWMAPELLEVWQVLVRDVLSAGAILPWVAPMDRGEGLPDSAEMLTWWPDGVGAGVSVRIPDAVEERLAHLADDFQVAEVEGLWSAGRSPVWPECPLHPGTHPLQARLVDRAAVWTCGDVVIAPVGGLAEVSARP